MPCASPQALHQHLRADQTGADQRVQRHSRRPGHVRRQQLPPDRQLFGQRAGLRLQEQRLQKGVQEALLQQKGHLKSSAVLQPKFISAVGERCNISSNGLTTLGFLRISRAVSRALFVQ